MTDARAGRLGVRLFAVVLLVLAGIVLFDALRIAQGSGVGPQQSGFFPMIVGIGLAVFAVAFLLRTTVWADEDLARSAAEEHSNTHWRTLWIVVAGLIAYVIVLDPLGYIVSTAVFFAAMAWVVGGRRPVRDTIVAVLFAVAVYVGFTELLGVRLPAGVLAGVL